MKSALTKKVTIGETIEKVESKLEEIELLEKAMGLTLQELAVVKGRIEMSWQVVRLRVTELRGLIADLKEFTIEMTNGHSSVH